MASVSHSWLQYCPPLLSPEAARVAVQHDMSRSRKNQKQSGGSSRQDSKRGSGLSLPLPAGFTSLTTGLMRDAFKRLQENVTNTITRIRPGGGTGRPEQQKEERSAPGPARSVSSNVSLYDFKDAIDEYENEVKNEDSRVLADLCPNTSTSTSTPGSRDSCSYMDDVPSTELERNLRAEATQLSSDGQQGREREQDQVGGDLKRSVAAASRGAQSPSLFDSELVLSPASRRLSSFLHQHRPALAYRLMCIVTLRSVNHENICCINSTLLIFIFARRA